MTGQSKAINMMGKRFGKLLVVSRYGTRNRVAMWNCLCNCGTKIICAGKSLRKGETKSCGCVRREAGKRMFTTHGMYGTPTYYSWAAMLDRCRRKNNPAYKSYGAIGISVCERWKNSFVNFLKDMGIKPNGLSLDRINPFGNYEPGNCRWATNKEQAINRRGPVAIAILKTLQSEFSIESILSLPR